MTLEIRKQFTVLFQGDGSGHENKYVKLLNEEGIRAETIPTLSFNFINREQLQNCIYDVDSYSGIVFTSTRAVNAVSSALMSSVDSPIENWKEKQNFSIGRATADLAKSLLNLSTQGADCGNSEKLCERIIEIRRQISKPLLFPCSNIRKDTIPDTLSKNGIPVEEIICYETIPNIHFENLWQNLISKEGLPEILIFFSPSGVQSSFKIIKDTYSVLPKFIAIGPSTEKALLELEVSCKTAEKPTPESVLNVVKNVLDI